MSGTLAGMTDNLTLTGLVATVPRHFITAEGFPVTSFRLASNLRRFDRRQKVWVDAGTNWYSISTYRELAVNVAGSVQKGDRVLVTGRLRISPWGSGEKRGVNIDVDADALGHDLTFGKASFTRSIRSTPVEAFFDGAAAPEGDGAEASEAAETEAAETGAAETGAGEAEAGGDETAGLALTATPF